MPIVTRQPEPITSLATGVLPDAVPDASPDTGSIFGAAFRQNNLIGSFITHMGGASANDLDPGYSAWDEIKGTPYEEHWQSFAASNNRRYTDSLKRHIDTEERDRRTLAAGGWTSTLANLGAVLTDPTILIPVGGEVLKGVQGYRILRSGVGAAVAGGAGTAVQETGLQLTQETRSTEESVQNVGWGIVLSGLLGAGAAAVLSKSERAAARKGFDRLLSAPVNSSAGAAQTSRSLGLDALSVDGGTAGKIAQATQQLNPGLRLNFSPSPVARQIGQELAEGSVYQTGHAQGLTVGPAVERLAGGAERSRTADGLGRLNQAFSDMKKSGVSMSFDDFDAEVGRAMRNEDIGENEFISRAAREMRSSIVDPFFEDGKAVGLYDDGDKVAFAPSYFPRQYRTKVLIAHEPQIKAEWTSYMSRLIGGQYREALDRFTAERATLDQALADLSLSRSKRSTALRSVEAERARMIDESPEHADRYAQAAEAAAREAGDKSALRKATELRRTLKREGGTAFVEWLDKATKVKARADRLGMTDAAAVKALKGQIATAKAEAQRTFLDRWEIRHMGEGIDLGDTAGRVDFSDMARGVVDEIYDKLTGRDYGDSGSVAAEYMTPIARGPVRERTLPIPDSILTAQGVLEDRASDVLRRYARILSADVELTRKFGSPRMDAQLKRLADDYAALRQGVVDPKALRKLNDRQNADQRDIEAMRDLIRGTYRREQNSNGWARASRVAGHYNFITKMGGIIVGSLSDIYRPAMVHGLRRYMDEGIRPLLTNFEAVKLSTQEAKLAGVVVDRVLQHRIMAISGLGDPFERGTAFERTMESMSRFAGKWSGIALWNDSMKATASILSQNRILSGQADRRTLAFLGIDSEASTAIRQQFKAHGEVLDGVHVAHTERWTDPDAVRAFRAAVGKDVDSVIVTPGVADAPLLSHTPLGRALLQFKSYTLSSHQKVLLRGLQEGKGGFVSGMAGMTALGILATTLRAWRSGEERWQKFKKASENPGYLIGEGLDASGIFALGFDIANTAEREARSLHFSFNPIKTPMMAAGSWAYPDASQQGESIRYSSRGPWGALLGPTGGLVEDALNTGAAGVDAARGRPMTAAEKRRAVNLLPFSSFYGFREGAQALTDDSPYDDDFVPVGGSHEPSQTHGAH